MRNLICDRGIEKEAQWKWLWGLVEIEIERSSRTELQEKIIKRDKTKKGTMENGRGVYKGWYGEKLELMRAWIKKESKGVQTLIDFNTNCKTGKEEGRIRDVGEESYERKAQSSDKKINVEGRMSRLEQVRWIIFNDNIKEKDN